MAGLLAGYSMFEGRHSPNLRTRREIRRGGVVGWVLAAGDQRTSRQMYGENPTGWRDLLGECLGCWRGIRCLWDGIHPTYELTDFEAFDRAQVFR